MAKKKNTVQKNDEKSGEIIFISAFEFIKDIGILLLGDIMDLTLAIFISFFSGTLAYLGIHKFKTSLQEKWDGKIKWAIIIIFLFALSVIPLGVRTLYQSSEMNTQIKDNRNLLLTQSEDTIKLSNAAETIQSMQSTLDYQAAQLSKSTPTPTKTLIATPTFPLTPTSTPTPDELIIESLNQFVTMINNGEIAEAYDTLFTQYYRDTHTWLDFEKYWGTQVKKISISIIVSPYIPEDNIVSETNVEITIIIEGREYDPDVFIWNICHYEESNEWLINNLYTSGKDCIER